jgi:hypothetical protein
VVCIADVGALSANADSASAKPKHGTVSVLIKIVRWPRLFGQISRFDKWNVCRG